MGSSWKLIAVFSVLFVTGAICGSLITSSIGPKPVRPNATHDLQTWTNDLAEKVKKNGKLTPDQQAKARPLLEAAVRQMQGIRLQSMIQISDTFDASIVEIKKDLPPAQQELLERFREKRRKWMQRQIERRGEGGER
jgi:hypothetical protein